MDGLTGPPLHAVTSGRSEKNERNKKKYTTKYCDQYVHENQWFILRIVFHRTIGIICCCEFFLPAAPHENLFIYSYLMLTHTYWTATVVAASTASYENHRERVDWTFATNERTNQKNIGVEIQRTFWHRREAQTQTADDDGKDTHTQQTHTDTHDDLCTWGDREMMGKVKVESIGKHQMPLSRCMANWHSAASKNCSTNKCIEGIISSFQKKKKTIHLRMWCQNWRKSAKKTHPICASSPAISQIFRHKNHNCQSIWRIICLLYRSSSNHSLTYAIPIDRRRLIATTVMCTARRIDWRVISRWPLPNHLSRIEWLRLIKFPLNEKKKII